MQESSLYAPLTDGAGLEGWRLVKLEDGGRMKKPFDIVGCDPYGVGVGVEVKVLRGTLLLPHLLPRPLFEVQQIEWLSAFAEMGALALVAFYWERLTRLEMFRLSFPTDWERPTTELFCGALRREAGCFRGWNKLCLA